MSLADAATAAAAIVLLGQRLVYGGFGAREPLRVGGRIAEAGTHDDLMNAGGRDAERVTPQAAAYR